MLINRGPYHTQRYKRGLYNAGSQMLRRAIPWGLKKAINYYYREPTATSSGRQAPAPRKTVRRSYRRKSYRPKTKKPIRKEIKEIKKSISNDTGTHTERYRAVGRMLTSTENTIFQDDVIANSASLIETPLAGLKYYNPATPGTLTTADGATGTFSHKFLFDSIYSHVRCVNNYQTPVYCTLYLLTPKGDTSVAPQEAFTSGLADIGSPSATSPLVHPTDSPVFNELWKIHKSVSKRLGPGQEMTLSHSIKKLVYDTAYNDAHTSTFKKIEGAHVYLIRVEGSLGHDLSSNQQGRLPCGVDYEMNRKYVIKYNAGIDLTTLVVNDASHSFTNYGVVSQRPASDNQAYSIG